VPGTAPTGWQNPKTSYTADDVLTPEQFERIEGNAYATELGARTIDPSQSPTGVIGTLRQLLDWFANRIKAILGTTNWHDAPPTTLTAAKSHIDAAAPHSGHATTAALTAHTSAAAPHSGHETPSGAQAKVDAHAAGTNVHGATSAATANRIMLRDANGRAKVAAPAASDDIARKDTVDAKFDPSTGHRHTGTAGDGPKIAIACGDIANLQFGTGTIQSSNNVWVDQNVTFPVPFTAEPVVVATLNRGTSSTSTTLKHFAVKNVSPNGFTFSIWDVNTNNTYTFYWIAMAGAG
jgi:hypothetical protein